MADVVVGKQYDAHTGQWREIYGPDVSVAKTPVAPQNETNIPSLPTGGEATVGAATKEYKDREFNLEGQATVMPNPHIEARCVIEYMGLGNQFSGRYFLKTVRHTWSKSGGYIQEHEVTRNGFGGFSEKRPTAADTNPVRPTKEQVEPESDATYYIVKKGDTLWAIAKRYYGNGNEYTKIATANNISNPNMIFAGQKLLIP